MQKDLLAERHLPKLHLKRIQNTVQQNSSKFACLTDEKYRDAKKIKTMPPGFKAIVGANASDFPESKFSFSSGQNGKSKIIFKKTLYPKSNFSNELAKLPRSVLRSSPTVSPGSVHEPKTKDTMKTIEFRSLFRRSLPNSKILPKESNLQNVNNSVKNCTEIKNLKEVIADEEEPEVEVILDTKAEKHSSRSILKQKSVADPESTPGTVETILDTEEEPQPFCVISEVIGNANMNFSDLEDSPENEQGPQESEISEPRLITPQKTNDITKIKGWRRKQFFVEKPTTVEFYSVSKSQGDLDKKTEEPGNIESAFFSDSLNEFLDREADLKIGYEIPHLYAEFGIKLTKDEVVSRPNLPEKDIVEIETRYCRLISLPSDNCNLDDIPDEIFKGLKRPIEDDSKPSKILKVNDNKTQEPDLEVICLSSNNSETVSKVPNKCDLSDMKLLSKLIALVVYPNPYTPLHPVVQYHLNKIRSYRTVVDKRWAMFAASAVLDSNKRAERKIVPAYCCVKADKSSTTEIEKIEEEEVVEEKKEDAKEIIIKPCRVVLKKLDTSKTRKPWCMEHNCYNCVRCGLAKRKQRTEGITPRESINRKIARLLAKKVKLLKANGDTLTSIDCLKVLKRDTVEFIKLKFVKESFLTGYINIWYLKPQKSGERSRAFLTFSKYSPISNAINLKSTVLSVEHLPKVITEIVSKENTFDSNEYAILHCRGGVWEIHGSLNISFGNGDKNVKQIFSSVRLPELKKLQKIASEILHVEAVKWWVLDLSQMFKLIELKSGNVSTVVTREKILDVITLNLFGFLPLRKDMENRVVGAYIIQRLLPFVLIGPYYLLEKQDMILKGVSSTVPFKYYGEENVTTNYPLKFFINSVIKNLEGSQCQVEGLWLYDKMCLDKTSYIEIVTKTNEDTPSPNKYSNIEVEHGYSLNSLTHTSTSGAASGIVKRRDGKSELQTVTVYLYFNVFELGFVEGELQFDNSVIINHPLDARTKMKSHKIGDWFLRKRTVSALLNGNRAVRVPCYRRVDCNSKIFIIKRRIKFIPTDLEVKWFITKHKPDLSGRLPFHKFVLGGAHVLTKDGILYLPNLKESQLEKLGLERSEIMKALSESEVLKEVRELKNLASLFADNSHKSLTMDELLTRAVNEIKALKTTQKTAKELKMKEEARKFILASDYLKLVNSLRIRHHYKIKMVSDIQYMFVDEDGYLTEDFVRKLRKHRIGWKFLKRLEAVDLYDGKGGVKFKMKETRNDKFQIDNLGQFMTHFQKRSQNINFGSKNQGSGSNTVRTTNAQSNCQFQNTALRQISRPFSSFQNKRSQILKISTPVIEPLVEIEVLETPDVVLENKFTEKTDRFSKPTSTNLPETIKASWKNWIGKKLEVT